MATNRTFAAYTTQHKITMLTWTDIKHFKPGEFDSPGEPGTGLKMSLPFVHKLDKVRAFLKRPLRVNSGYRTAAHNAKVGGVPNSAHTKGLAADIRCTDSGMRLALIDAARAAGIARIGVGTTLVHLDDDSDLPSNVLWVYTDK